MEYLLRTKPKITINGEPIAYNAAGPLTSSLCISTSDLSNAKDIGSKEDPIAVRQEDRSAGFVLPYRKSRAFITFSPF